MNKNSFQEKNYALIVANGEMPSDNLIEELLKSAQFVLAADGGANHLAELNIQPDTIIGDLDSVNEETKTKFESVNIIKRESQEESDLEKSIIYLLSLGYQTIVITAVQGKREDHSFAALQLIKKYKRKAQILVVSDYSEIFLLLPGISSINTTPDQIISLFGFPRAYGIKTDGLKYPLSKENIFESSRGISNVALRNEVSIEFQKGNLLVFRNLKADG